MTKTPAKHYGLLAEFTDAEALIEAIESVRKAGYKELDAYSPMPVEAVAEALGEHDSPLPKIVLFGGLTGCFLGYSMQYYASVIAYPLNIGGKPLHSWPSFMPITFECTILFAAFAAVIGMFFINRLPMPWHPLFNVQSFERATQDRFFLCVKANDPKYNPRDLEQLLRRLKPESIAEVAP